MFMFFHYAKQESKKEHAKKEALSDRQEAESPQPAVNAVIKYDPQPPVSGHVPKDLRW